MVFGAASPAVKLLQQLPPSFTAASTDTVPPFLQRGDELYVANAGDSRGVLCRGDTAIPLSEDHKPASDIEKNRIIAAGGGTRGGPEQLSDITQRDSFTPSPHRPRSPSLPPAMSMTCSPPPSAGFLSDIGGVCRVNGNLNLSRAIGDLK